MAITHPSLCETIQRSNISSIYNGAPKAYLLSLKCDDRNELEEWNTKQTNCGEEKWQFTTIHDTCHYTLK